LIWKGSPEVNKSGYVGQVSIPAGGEYAHLLALGYDEDNGQKFETLWDRFHYSLAGNISIALSPKHRGVLPVSRDKKSNVAVIGFGTTTKQFSRHISLVYICPIGRTHWMQQLQGFDSCYILIGNMKM